MFCSLWGRFARHRRRSLWVALLLCCAVRSRLHRLRIPNTAFSEANSGPWRICPRHVSCLLFRGTGCADRHPGCRPDRPPVRHEEVQALDLRVHDPRRGVLQALPGRHRAPQAHRERLAQGEGEARGGKQGAGAGAGGYSVRKMRENGGGRGSNKHSSGPRRHILYRKSYPLSLSLSLRFWPRETCS